MRIALFASSLTSTGRRFQSSRCDGWCVSSRVCLHVPNAIRHHLGRTVFDTPCPVKAAIASLSLLPVALALEILPHVRLSRPPLVCPRLTRMHARPMSQSMASSACTVVWLLSGTLFPSVFCESLRQHPHARQGAQSRWRSSSASSSSSRTTLPPHSQLSASHRSALFPRSQSPAFLPPASACGRCSAHPRRSR